MEYPKIRAISAFPVEVPGKTYICLQDPHRYQKEPLVISPETFSVIQFFDGNHSYLEIQEAYMRRYGILLYQDQLQHLVEQLDRCLLLESPTFFEHVEQLRAEFARIPIRPSSHAGSAYPDTKEELTKQLSGYFTASDGPGPIPSTIETAPIKAIMAPHINVDAGGPTFAWAYHALIASDADVFIILGTAHVDTKNFLALTRKDFETPFGIAETDRAFIESLAAQLPYDPFEDELVHKAEHSIEFQVIFLQYLASLNPERFSSLKIVPILCGGQMLEMIMLNRPLNETPQLEDSIRGLQHVLAGYPKACLIASVDFSHIGLRYGDAEAPGRYQLIMVEQVDRNLLAAMEKVDHQGFGSQLQRTRNTTNVCGIVPIYTMLRLIEGTQGTLLHYDRTESGPGSIVTFASMVWKA